MKKSDDDKYLYNPNLNLKKKPFFDHIKTTNINILLNRVKVEKKNDFKKKMFLSSLMFVIVSFFIFIVISI